MGVKTRKANRKLWTRTEVAIVHFVHRPKPWEAALAQPTAELWKLAERYNIEPLVRRALSAMDCDCCGSSPNVTPSSQSRASHLSDSPLMMAPSLPKN